MWDNVLELMTVIAVITNCALIGVTSTRWWPSEVSRATRVLVVVVAEHVILFLKVRACGWIDVRVGVRAYERDIAERGGLAAVGCLGSRFRLLLYTYVREMLVLFVCCFGGRFLFIFTFGLAFGLAR